MTQNKVLSYIGLATKAGKVVSGEFSVEKAVKDGRATMVFVADDSSDNTKKLFTNMCEFYRVPIYFLSDKETLGHAIGKQFRASLAIMDKGFTDAIEKQLKNK
ncbi:MAG: L7Ae/L30e/S12e/Gadd45 family ribosomal protein [Lachnospiraceae bacterium]